MSGMARQYGISIQGSEPCSNGKRRKTDVFLDCLGRIGES